MNFKMMAAALFSLNLTSAWAVDIDHCPLPHTIKNTQGVYSAPTVSGKGQWVGIATIPRTHAQDRFSADAVTTFQGAVFHGTARDGFSRGVLSRCLYSNANQESVDLYFRPDVRPALAVRLLDSKQWKLQPVSSTGLHTYICKSRLQGGCVFAVLE